MSRREHWWENGVVYQIYPRSWADSNGDGMGDLCGIISRLDHLEWLGVDAIWLNPVCPSPDRDWGYDVSDYRGVHPDLGSLDDLELLIKEAHTRDIAVVLDLVPNHTSDQHPWFLESRSANDSPKRDWYVWHAARPDGSPPNNWRRAIGSGPAWTFDLETGEYYMHSFLPQQPDLNWWNEDVRGALDDIIRYWFDRGIDGFRIDVVQALIHDPSLQENPPVTPEDAPQVQRIGQRQIYNMNRPEVHDIIRRWREIADTYGDRALIGETYLFDLASVGRYYGDGGDELHLAFNFPFMFADLDAAQLSGIVDSMFEALPGGAPAAWAGSNHDAGRFATRWAGGDIRKAKVALMMLLTLPGVTFLYYGDEIGLPEVAVPRDRLLDPAGIARWPERGRDPARTPMPWAPGPGAGFTSADVEPWLPIGDTHRYNVEDQKADPTSMVHLTRRLVELRDDPSLAGPRYERVGLVDGLWGYRRGDDIEVWLNMSDRPRPLDTHDLVVLESTEAIEDDASHGPHLEPWQGMVARRRARA